MMTRNEIENIRTVGHKGVTPGEFETLCDLALLATRGLQFVFLDKSLETSKLLMIVDGEPVGGLVALGLVANSQHRFAELRVVFPNLNDVNNPDMAARIARVRDSLRAIGAEVEMVKESDHE